MKQIILTGLMWTIVTLLFVQCDSPVRQYERMVRAGLASGERHDSLFLGIYLSMPAKEFYDHCWELNKQRLVKEGAGNTSVLYYPPDFRELTQMTFYPKFHEDKIYEMPIEFMYEAWAPWNKQYHADQLEAEVLRVLEKWYGGGFIRIEHPERGGVSVKVDGNRRISVWHVDNQKVKVLITDLIADQAVKSAGSNRKERGTSSGISSK